MISQLSNMENAENIDAEAADEVMALLSTARSVASRNRMLHDYFEGDYDVEPLGIETVPECVRPTSRCGWPRKAVTAVSERARLDGFVFDGGYYDAGLRAVERRCNVVASYNRDVADELVYGCMFATVGREDGRGAYVRFHDATSATAIWDYAGGCLASGLVIAGTGRAKGRTDVVPTRVNLHMPGRTVMFSREPDSPKWRADSVNQPFDEPCMVAFCYRPTEGKPFGQTRITAPVRDIADSVTRTLRDMAVSSAFFSAPQKYLLGVSDEMFDMITKDKWSTYIGSLLVATSDPDGGTPAFGQLSGSDPQAFISQLRLYSSLFTAETGVSLNSMGITTDNPSSAQAIVASREDICIAASDLNEDGRDSMRKVALMAMAVEGDTTLDGLTDEQRSVDVKFKDPSMPSVVSTADAMCKLASCDEGFAGTSVFYEGVGFDSAMIERVRGEKRQTEARRAYASLLGSAPERKA